MKDLPRGGAPHAQRTLIHNGKSGCAGKFRESQPAVLESSRKWQWKATLDRPLIRSNSRWRPKPKRTTPSTISLTKKASHSCECWRVFSAQMCFRKELDRKSVV